MSYLDVTQNPELLQALVQRARCERAEAMYRLLVLPIKRRLTGVARTLKPAAAT